jgi:endonuclease/exonuclease/phosphatase family metal-dependent hydrolase
MCIKIVSWNILGHKHTHHNYKHHRNGLANVETDEQKNIRKYKNTQTLNKIDADIVLLQEFSGCEIDISNKYKNTLKNIDTNEPGCYIFYKNDKLLLINSYTISIGYNKNAVVAEFLDIILDKKFKVVSFHLVGGKNSETYQIEQIKILENNIIENQPIILGGDCNQRDIKFLNNNSKFLFIDSEENTAMIQNMSKPGRIDYFAVNNLSLNKFQYNGVFVKPTIHPWSYRCLIGSDHVPLIGTFEL